MEKQIDVEDYVKQKKVGLDNFQKRMRANGIPATSYKQWNKAFLSYSGDNQQIDPSPVVTTVVTKEKQKEPEPEVVEYIPYINRRVAKDKIVTLVAAVCSNGLIGSEGKIPFKCTEHDAYLKEVTRFKTVIMGRKTYESINLSQYQFKNCIVVSSTLVAVPQGIIPAYAVEEAVAIGQELEDGSLTNEVICIGGGEVFRQLIRTSHNLVITEIDESFEGVGDTYFPYIDKKLWKEYFRYDSKQTSGMKYNFVRYKRS